MSAPTASYRRTVEMTGRVEGQAGNGKRCWTVREVMEHLLLPAAVRVPVQLEDDTEPIFTTLQCRAVEVPCHVEDKTRNGLDSVGAVGEAMQDTHRPASVRVWRQLEYRAASAAATCCCSSSGSSSF
jgi:hypothetical protein